MFRRRRAREVALQVLYQDDLNPRVDPHEADSFLVNRLREPDLIEFARSLVAGVRRHRAELDAQVEKYAQNWKLHRMAATDRNVLRLGVYEILFGGTPGVVAVNEALELSKRFGSANSPAFVNGILDRFIRPTPPAEGKSGVPDADMASQPRRTDSA